MTSAQKLARERDDACDVISEIDAALLQAFSDDAAMRQEWAAAIVAGIQSRRGLRAATALEHDQIISLVSEMDAVIGDAIKTSARLRHSAATAILTGLSRRHGAGELYVRAGSKHARNQSIRAEFNGTNLKEVCRKYGVGRMTVYRVIGRY